MVKRNNTDVQFIKELEGLKPHDHLCIIYESNAEWEAAIIPFIRIGLERKEKCIYVADANTADELRDYLSKEGIAAASFEESGQLTILRESDVYTKGDSFDPDRIINLLITETEKAVRQGYAALRVTGEMTFVLKGVTGSERLLEYEAKLNRDLFPKYPCLAICQYDRWKFDPDIIKGVIMTHPKLIHGTRVSSNFYYIPTKEFLNQKRAEMEAQHWLNNVAREQEAREELVESEVRYQRLFEAAKEGILILNAESGIIRDINPYLLDLMGYSRQEILGKRLWELGLFKDRLCSQDSFRELQEKGYIRYEDLLLETKDGGKVDVEFVSNSYLVNSEMVIQCNIRNITEHKRVEEEIKNLAKFPGENPNPVFRVSKDGTILYTNRPGLPLLAALGCSVGQSAPEYWHKLVLDAIGSGSSEAAEIECQERIFSLLFAPVAKAGYVNIYGLDVTERNQAWEKIRHLNLVLRAIRNVNQFITKEKDRGKLLEGACKNLTETTGYYSAWIALLDESGKLTEYAESGLGRSFLPMVKRMKQGRLPACGQTALKQPEAVVIDDQALTCTDCPISYKLAGRGGMTIRLEHGGKVYGLLSVSVPLKLANDAEELSLFHEAAGDITFALHNIEMEEQRKQAEAERRELEMKAQVNSRLASVGEMAAGIAHEINNPLTGVVGFSGILMEKDLPEDLREAVKIIHDGSQRVAGIVKMLLTFARQHKPERTYADINGIIESTLILRKYSLETGNIEVSTSLDAGLPCTMADAAQLQQVFMNIIVNAETEMNQAHGRGKLTIKTERIGNTIRISFADDGPGIAKENIGKVFDPFFTTREVGEGTGLGLSLSYGIISEHKGALCVKSRLGKGATFFIELPIIAEERQLDLAEPAGETKGVSGGRILVVDDEPTILAFLKKLLGGEGYDVATVSSGMEALGMIKNKRYGLILCDIKLPGLSGVELYERIEKVAPSLQERVIFITGDVTGTDTGEFLKRTKAPYVTKPFDIAELRKEVKRVIAGAG